MEKIRRKSTIVKTDEDLIQDGKYKDFFRKQTLLDSLNRVTTLTIYIFPVIILFLFIILIIHYLQIGDWNSIQDSFNHLLAGILGYILAYLQKNGITSTSKD